MIADLLFLFGGVVVGWGVVTLAYRRGRRAGFADAVKPIDDRLDRTQDVLRGYKRRSPGTGI
jgi:hypothetical protein